MNWWMIDITSVMCCSNTELRWISNKLVAQHRRYWFGTESNNGQIDGWMGGWVDRLIRETMDGMERMRYITLYIYQCYALNRLLSARRLFTSHSNLTFKPSQVRFNMCINTVKKRSFLTITSVSKAELRRRACKMFADNPWCVLTLLHGRRKRVGLSTCVYNMCANEHLRLTESQP